MTTPSLRNSPHRHLAASVLIGLEKPFVLGIDRQEEKLVEAALIAPDVQQHLDSMNGPMLILHVDPDVPLYRQLSPHLKHRNHLELPLTRFGDLIQRMRAALLHPLDCSAARKLVADIVARVRGDAMESPPLDARIGRITSRFREHVPDRIDPDALAAEAGLSRSRLLHLFKAEIGTSMRRFALTLRLQNAIRRWRAGVSLTTVAHDAGFYDLSHLLQAGRGYSGDVISALPSMFAEGGRLQVYQCEDGC